MHKKRINRPSESGFTLNEMIKVVAIIAVLAGIAVFSFHYYTLRAYNIIAKHDLQHFVQAQKDYNAKANLESIVIDVSDPAIKEKLKDLWTSLKQMPNMSAKALVISGYRRIITIGRTSHEKSYNLFFLRASLSY